MSEEKNLAEYATKLLDSAYSTGLWYKDSMYYFETLVSSLRIRAGLDSYSRPHEFLPAGEDNQYVRGGHCLSCGLPKPDGRHI